MRYTEGENKDYVKFKVKVRNSDPKVNREAERWRMAQPKQDDDNENNDDSDKDDSDEEEKAEEPSAKRQREQ